MLIITIITIITLKVFHRMNLEWFLTLICDINKAAFTFVVTVFAGAAVKFTSALMYIAGPIPDETLNNFITSLFQWLYYFAGFVVFLLAIMQKLKNWHNKRTCEEKQRKSNFRAERHTSDKK
jgi:bacteriorhodopsin